MNTRTTWARPSARIPVGREFIPEPFMPVSADDFLRIGPRVRVLPIIHGSGDFAICVRDELLARPYDCVAVPLPPSFQAEVEAAVEQLPVISAVVQRDGPPHSFDEEPGFSYV